MKYSNSIFSFPGATGFQPHFKKAAGRWRLLAAATHRAVVTAGTVEKNDAEMAFLAEAEEP